jgi:hypothetical protein
MKSTGRKLRGYGCCHATQTKWLHKVHGYDEQHYVGWGAEDRDLELRAQYDGMKMRWVHDHTNMVHLPHSQNGEYYNEGLIQKNLDTLERFKNIKDKKEKMRRIIANGDNWGEL